MSSFTLNNSQEIQFLDGLVFYVCDVTSVSLTADDIEGTKFNIWHDIEVRFVQLHLQSSAQKKTLLVDWFKEVL